MSETAATPGQPALKTAEDSARIDPETGFSDDQIIDHAIRIIRSSYVAKEPFEHSIIDRTLPEKFFEQVAAAFPSPEKNQSWLNEVRGRRTGENDGYSDRRLSLTPTSMPPEEYALVPAALRQACSALINPRFSGALMKPFMSIIEPRLLQLIQKQKLDPATSTVVLRPSCEFIYDRTGFNLSPHTDGSVKAMTALLYVAAEGDPETLGTHVYQANNPDELTADHRSGKEGLLLNQATSIGHAPYRPNVMLFFARSDKSFHGVPPSSSTHPRRLIQLSIMIDGIRVK
jgi:hypothetical protein